MRKRLITMLIMVFISLIPVVYSESVDWIKPADIADSLYGLLIYDGNINITFDGTFTVAGAGENDTDTNESIRFEELIDSDCVATDKMVGVGTDGNVTCIADVDTDTDTKWIMAPPYFSNDSDTAYFNNSQFEVIYYNATLSKAIAGTVVGTLALTQHQDGHYDGITLNVTEASGSPGLDLRLNFTSIESFSRGVIRYRTSSLAGAYPIIQMWNYNTSAWEDYPPVAESSTFATITQPVFDAADHLKNGIAQMRIYKAGNGNTNNKYYIDWIAISKGYGVPSGEEIDPYAVYRDGTREMTGNWNTGAYKITMEGELILQAIATVMNVTPVTNNLYALGNSTNWFSKLYATDIYNVNFYGNYINASEINTTDINSDNVNSTTIEVDENITIGNHVLKKDGEDLIITLN